jgi:hypothetical protein
MGACGNTKEIENTKPLNQNNQQTNLIQDQNNPYQNQTRQHGEQIIYANQKNTSNNDVNNQIYQHENKYATNKKS